MLLEVNPETVRFIVDRMRRIQVKDDIPVTDPTDDWSRQMLADDPNDPVVTVVRSVIEDLGPAQQVELVALTWVGRGDFSADEWDNAVAQARDSWNERTADYLLGTPLVADYIEEGLDQIGFGDAGADEAPPE